MMSHHTIERWRERSKCCIATAALHMCLNREHLSEWRREEGKEEVVKERQQRKEVKTAFSNELQLQPNRQETYGHQSKCSPHVIKSTHLNIELTKDEPDRSTHAREKWHITITAVFGPPCRSSHTVPECATLLGFGRHRCG